MGRFAGGEIVFTGPLVRMSRAQQKEIAEALGARAAGAVSAATVLVVRGEPPHSAAKIRTAEAYGIEICDEDQLIAYLREAGVEL